MTTLTACRFERYHIGQWRDAICAPPRRFRSDTFKVTPDREGKPKEIVGSWADISDHKNIEASLRRLSEQVELRNQLISRRVKRWLVRLSLPPNRTEGGNAVSR
jgi:hypothetical protein